ncbi:abhydrolase domain-containing protein 8 [Plakobranchus ocellatus]|uniref:acylglycerol lipase n=1 Tax=Plakobranchus ocellatus TaxID=259542 RepID=A0AAV3Y6K2_9GAST|nr:abhydrolase domain-containing protein 8 [Plakobranchus ocellatus]
MSGIVPGSLLRSQRVRPSKHGSDENHIMVELRSSRRLHVLHLNPRPRDQRFQQEMTLYLQYRKLGTGIAGGPLTMPRRKTCPKPCDDGQNSSGPAQVTKTSHPLSVTSEIKMEYETSEVNSTGVKSATKILPEAEDMPVPYEGPSNASSLLSSPAHSTPVNNTRSASSVLLALHNQGRPQQATNQLPQVPDDNDENLHLSLSPKPQWSKNQDNNSGQSPLSPKTQINDASTCIDLYNQDQDKFADVSSPKSIDSSIPACSSRSVAAPDKDLVIFFIHGVGGSCDIWRGQTEYFAQLGYEVIAPDLIGHGLSCAPNDQKAYHFREIAADMEELFDTYCKRRNVLVGHSYGASFATLLARTRARRVTRLVLVSGGPPSPLAPQPGVFTMPFCLLACIKPCLTRGFYKGAFNQKPSSSGLSAPRELAFEIPTRVLQYTMNGQDWPDGDELYHNWLTCPTLLLYGDRDKLVSLHEEQEMQRAVFDSRLEVIQEASHMVMMEASVQVNSLIHSFLLHPSPPTQTLQQTNSKGNVNSSSVEDFRSPSRSKSRKSLRSAKTPRSRPQRLLSKSVVM